MAEEKEKYVRKRCEHGKYSFQCKDCKGSVFMKNIKYTVKNVVVKAYVFMVV